LRELKDGRAAHDGSVQGLGEIVDRLRDKAGELAERVRREVGDGIYGASRT
jgi:hypothetical protein